MIKKRAVRKGFATDVRTPSSPGRSVVPRVWGDPKGLSEQATRGDNWTFWR
jgi:hypothetical protein